jgi:hypothetical protein
MPSSSSKVRNRSKSIEDSIRKCKLKERAQKLNFNKAELARKTIDTKFKIKLESAHRIKTEGNDEYIVPTFPIKKNERPITFINRISTPGTSGRGKKE